MGNYGYIYRITLLNKNSHLYLATYYGQHHLNTKYRNNLYRGSSSRLNREYWPFYNEYKKEILEYCNDQNSLNEREIFWIEYGKQHDLNCINVASGGWGDPYKYWTEEQMNEYKALQSSIAKRTNEIRYQKPEEREKQSKCAKKRWENPEEREKQSQRIRQYYIDHPEKCKERSKRRKGVNQFANQTEEQKAIRKEKNRKATQKRWDEFTPEQRANQVKGFTEYNNKRKKSN